MATSQVPSSQTFVTQVPALRDAAQKTFSQETFFQKSASFAKPDILGLAALASAGSTQATGAAIDGSAAVFNVSGGDGTKGVVLPTSVAGTQIKIYNAGAGILKVYPASGGAINGGTANASISMAAKNLATVINLDGTNWAASFA